MPVLKNKTAEGKTSEWYIDVPNTSGNAPPVYTLQVEPEGRDMLLNLGLNHADTEKKEADIEWDLFRTLNDLGLLFTYNTDYESGTASPSAETVKQLSSLSEAQRVDFAHSLLDEYTVTELFESEYTLKFFLSLETVSEELREGILERLLVGTPLTVETIENTDEIFEKYANLPIEETEGNGYNPVLLALFVQFVYIAWEASPDIYDELVSYKEGRPVWIWKNWITLAGSELMFYAGIDVISETVPDQILDELHDVSLGFGGMTQDILQTEFSALCIAQTLAQIGSLNPTLSRFIRAGFQRPHTSHGIIVPRPPDHTAESPESAFREVSETKSLEEKAKMKSAFTSKLE